MTSCDDLYFQSPVASAYETYGNTCGNRIPDADTNPLCTISFP